jgi:hypothetical protein
MTLLCDLSITGFCDTCKHEQIRNECLRKNLQGQNWKQPCRDCDIERNYLWESKKAELPPKNIGFHGVF